MPHGAAIAVIPHGSGTLLVQFWPGVLRSPVRGDFNPADKKGHDQGKSLFLEPPGEKRHTDRDSLCAALPQYSEES